MYSEKKKIISPVECVSSVGGIKSIQSSIASDTNILFIILVVKIARSHQSMYAIGSTTITPIPRSKWKEKVQGQFKKKIN